jgi:hypothetical protein
MDSLVIAVLYASAIEHSVASGIGWFRFAANTWTTVELDASVNPLSVYPDSNPIERDRSETMVCTPLRMTPPANG